jgi:hypothetical protein
LYLKARKCVQIRILLADECPYVQRSRRREKTLDRKGRLGSQRRRSSRKEEGEFRTVNTRLHCYMQ